MSQKLSKEQWAMARVYSFIDGNPKHDTDLRGGYTSKVQAKPDVIGRLEEIAVRKRTKGYYVYAIDGETQETMRWGPFTKKVAEFEKKLLHQRQRHHLQPIAEESEEGGVRGGMVGDDEDDEDDEDPFNDPLLAALVDSSVVVAVPIPIRMPSYDQDGELINANDEYWMIYVAGQQNPFVFSTMSGNEVEYLQQISRIDGEKRVFTTRFAPYDPALREISSNPKQDRTEPHIDEGRGRKKGGRMEVASSQPPPPPPPHNKRECQLPEYNPRPRHTIRRGQAEVEFREGDDMEEVLGELPDDAPPVQPIQARLPQRNRSSVRNLGMGKSSAYLRKARANAKAYGLDPKKLTMGEGKHKLTYDGIGFGLKNYNDFLLWSAEEKAGRVPKGTAEKKRKAYLARATKIKGDWKENKVSPNNLAIHILWGM